MRPVYESDVDRNHEDMMRREVLILLSKRDPEVYVEKNAALAHLDWTVYHLDTPVAVIEFKRRQNKRDAWATYNVSLRKNEAGLEWNQRTGRPAIIVVEWLDTMEWAYLHVPYGTIEGWGRTDREDALDVERAVAIPLEMFRPMAELPDAILRKRTGSRA